MSKQYTLSDIDPGLRGKSQKELAELLRNEMADHTENGVDNIPSQQAIMLAQDVLEAETGARKVPPLKPIEEKNAFSDSLDQIETMFRTQMLTLRRAAEDSQDPREGRLLSAFEGDLDHKMSRLNGLAKSIQALDKTGYEPDLLREKQEVFNTLSMQVYDDLEEQSHAFGVAMLNHGWNGTPEIPAAAAQVKSRPLATETRQLLDTIEESCSIAYLQKREIIRRFPEAEQLEDQMLKQPAGSLDDVEMTEALQAADDHVRSIAGDATELLRYGAHGAKPAELRVSFMNELNSFARQYDLDTRQFPRPTGKTIGSAPATETGTIDYTQVSAKAMSYVREYARLASANPNSSTMQDPEARKQFMKTMREIRRLARGIHDLEGSSKTVKQENLQSKATALLIRRLGQASNVVGLDAPWRLQDFQQAHENRRVELRRPRVAESLIRNGKLVGEPDRKPTRESAADVAGQKVERRRIAPSF